MFKDQVVKVWKDGTDKFYNDAKSIVSNPSYNGASSVISDLSRSRSASKDFVLPKKLAAFSSGPNLMHDKHNLVRLSGRSHSHSEEEDFEVEEQYLKPPAKKKFIETFAPKSDLFQGREGAISPLQMIQS